MQLGTSDVTVYRETKRNMLYTMLQCTYEFGTIVDLVQVSENVLSELVAGILNKQNWNKDSHSVIFHGPMGGAVAVSF